MLSSKTNVAPEPLSQEEKDRREAAIKAALASSPAEKITAGDVAGGLAQNKAETSAAALGAGHDAALPGDEIDDDAEEAKTRKLILRANFVGMAKNLREAEAEAATAADMFVRAQLDVEATGFCNLAMAIADVVYYLIAPEEPLISLRRDGSAASQVIAYLANLDMFKQEEMAREKNRKGELIIIGKSSRFSRIDRNTWNAAAQAALLVATGRRTTVQWGYVSGEISKGLLPQMLWQPYTRIGKDKTILPTDTKVYLGVCAAASTVRPMIYTSTKDVMDPVTKRYPAQSAERNSDKSLRYLTLRDVNWLYRHFFAGEKLAYETTSANQGTSPTGRIIGIVGKPSAARKPAAGQGDAAAQAVAKLGDDIARGLVDLATKLRGAKHVTDIPSKAPADLITAALMLAEAAIECGCRTALFNAPGNFDPALASLRNSICLAVSDETKAGDMFMRDPKTNRNTRKLDTERPNPLAKAIGLEGSASEAEPKPETEAA